MWAKSADFLPIVESGKVWLSQDIFTFIDISIYVIDNFSTFQAIKSDRNGHQ